MGRRLITWARQGAGVSVLCVVLGLSFPGHSFAWGRNAQRLVVNKAIDTLETLPPEFRGFCESSRGSLAQPVTDPLDAIAKSPTTRPNHLSLPDKYARCPCEAL